MKASKIPGNFIFFDFQWGGRELNTILTLGFSITSCGTRELRLYDARFQISTHAQRWREAQAGGSRQGRLWLQRIERVCPVAHSIPCLPRPLFTHTTVIYYYIQIMDAFALDITNPCMKCIHMYPGVINIAKQSSSFIDDVPMFSIYSTCRTCTFIDIYRGYSSQTCLRRPEARSYLPVGLYGTSHSILWPLRLLEEDLNASGLKPSWVAKFVSPDLRELRLWIENSTRYCRC